MNIKQRIVTIFVLLVSLSILSCRTGQLFVPKVTPIPSSTPTPTGPLLGHWKGGTDNMHWSIVFDFNKAGQIVNVGINYYDTFNNPCSFEIKNIPLKGDNSFDQDVSYADLERAVGVKGTISGEFINASTISGKLTISMCGRTMFFYEKDLPWTANWDGNSTTETPISSPTPLEQGPTLVPTSRTAIYLSQFKPTVIELGYGTYSVGRFAFTSDDPGDNIHDGDPIVVHDVEYPHGIFAHAPSRLVYELGDSDFGQLSATLGLVEWISCGDGVEFVVLLDGREVYRSGTLYPWSVPVDMQLPIDNGSELALVVEDGGNGDNRCDWAIWGDPRLR